MANSSSGYGKKATFVEEANYGYNPGEGNLRVGQDESKDQLRVDLGAVWDLDSLGKKNNLINWGAESTGWKAEGGLGNGMFNSVTINEPETTSDSQSMKQKITAFTNYDISNGNTIDEAIESANEGGSVAAVKDIARRLFASKEHLDLIVKGEYEVVEGDVLATDYTHNHVKAFFENYGGYIITDYPVIEKNKTFSDHYFELQIPFGPEEQAALNEIRSPIVADIKAEYGFYSKTYEEFTKTAGLSEEYLPNMYVLLAKKYENEAAIKAGQGETSSPLYLGIPPEELETLISDSGEKSDLNATSEYFPRYATILANNATNASIVNEVNKNKNIAVTAKNAKYLNDFNKKADFFPMHVSVDFSTQRDTSVGEMMDSSGMNVPLLRTVMHAKINNNIFSEANFRKTTESVELFEDGSPPAWKAVNNRLSTVKSIDLTGWVDEYADAGEDYFNDDAEKVMRFVGKDEVNVFKSPEPEHQFYKSFATMLLKGRLAKLAKDKVRSYKEVLQGKPAYSEIVLYRVAKHLVSDAGQVLPEPVQNFYFTNNNNLDILRFKDTQVVFGRAYKYIIHAYCLVVGTTYSYADVDTLDISGVVGAMAYAVYSPSIRLYEVPYYGQEPAEDTVVRMFDDPPVPPDVNMVPTRAVNNKINIFLNSNVGEYILPEVAIEETDQEVYAKTKQFQKLVGKNKNKIRFSTDDPPASFQVFRIGPDLSTGNTEKPTSYMDFRGKLHATIDTFRSTAGAFVDSVHPNKKYYYCFRSIDIHGNISLPTALYELEMVSEPGGQLAYPLIRVVDFFKGAPPKYIKSMRRFLHINPEEDHLASSLDYDPKSDEEPSLGLKQDPLFIGENDQSNSSAKKFKIRLTSKQTGKKIDVNVKFLHKHNKIFG